MNSLHFAENLIRLRKKRRVTQEELAGFIGVTKASVSKWETRQSLPDILLLPQLASFFDVSVDELLGYEPQLQSEQIQRYYAKLAKDFSKKPYDIVMEQCRELVKKYYSCFPFLFYIGVLWLNHFMLAGGEEEQQRALEEIVGLLEHILKECQDVRLCEDTAVLEAQVFLLQGKAKEVVERLEERTNPYRMTGQSDALLIQAYQMAGEEEKAVGYTQISMFLHMLSLVNAAVQYLGLQKGNLAVCEETIYRIDHLIELYQLEHLQSNVVALFELQAAVVYGFHRKEEQALAKLQAYVSAVEWLLKDDHLIQHGDAYFDQVAGWYEGHDFGMQAPREKSVILESALQGFHQPDLKELWEREEVQKLKQRLKELGEKKR
ncbi:MAG: helix-turn-helix transcriptional regulator [Lachnospiraceae bacterium]|jgi:transcriptional regulator with XRE-family HTH domain|nr:helix-turn-helix transcriptional regulator [Lachnospiraceae bacterium]MCX4317900.1 helix-turn-helix transcriptional regulator [Lachnospiraceae bacterium]